VIFRKELRRRQASIFWNFISIEQAYVNRINRFNNKERVEWKHDNIYYSWSFGVVRNELESAYVYLNSLNKLVNMQEQVNKGTTKNYQDYRELAKEALGLTDKSIKQTERLLEK